MRARAAKRKADAKMFAAGAAQRATHERGREDAERCVLYLSMTRDKDACL